MASAAGSKASAAKDALRLERVVAATATDASREWVRQAATMVAEQWPNRHSVDGLAARFVHASSDPDNYGLPASYLLMEGEECLGHARLTDCFEGFGGSAAAVTFVVICAAHRGLGLGRSLMSLIEAEATRLGYFYLYLWTQGAVGFYRKLGYLLCERVSLQRPCFRSLKQQQVRGLEALMARRAEAFAAGEAGGRGAAPPGAAAPAEKASSAEDVAGCEDVWLRKRLLEELPSQDVSRAERLREVAGEVARADPGRTASWRCVLIDVPWQRQVGPSCGLAALRMARDHFLRRSAAPASDGSSSKQCAGEAVGASQAQLPSLLAEARDRGMSTDGEIFNIDDLATLATEVCGLRCGVRPCGRDSPSSADLAASLRAGELWILPYDSHPGSKLPVQDGGHSAHYGLLSGVCFQCARADAVGGTDEALSEWDGAELACLDDACRVLFCVLHGVSPRLAIDTRSAFVASNVQLEDFNAAKYDLGVRPRKLNLKGKALCIQGLA